MENRKRSAAQESADSAPPFKKQATTINGTSKPHPDADMPWKDDLERFQKDAIWRQMQEYKREKNTLEQRLSETAKRSAYHDDHLRIIDTWFSQLLDEIRILVNDLETSCDGKDAGSSSFPSSLLFADNDKFDEHLRSRSKEIRSAIAVLFSKLPGQAADLATLQGQLAQLLATEKAHIVELDRVRAEKESLEARLENASYRYMLAERKADRAKSAAVAKLERQAIFGNRAENGNSNGTVTEGTISVKRESSTNGAAEDDSASELARKEAVAVADKQREQLEKLAAENEKLTSQLTAANVKLTDVTDDDYSRTNLFRHLKSQHEDVIKRINHLEATNVQLREEAEKLQAERTAYRVQMEKESQTAIGEAESRLARAENDLARIRTGRDELLADIAMRKASQEQERQAVEQIRELAAARDDRIKALESEVDRLLLQAGQGNPTSTTSSKLDDLSLEDLRRKFQALEKEYALLSNELPSMGEAWKKASALASKKVAEFAAWEEKLTRLSAEKVKADQKFFGAMKAKEARETEVRYLKAQNAKSSEIVMQLKEAEMATRSLVINLEKQLAETRDGLTTSTDQQRALQQQLSELNITTEGMKSQISELKKTITGKDATSSAALQAQQQAEEEAERLKVRLGETKKQLETWKNRSLGNQSEEYESLRTIAICTVCRKNFKNTAIKVCGHVFCKECVEERITSRSRKCPNCNKPFGSNDYMRVTL
ncbi:E3 ubiquitin-protein ligase Bre1 [Xylona heveae TC161]|uniref:E3 ubiquitin protein ligase n=1 Tax=Xylona heveae (strain CBS 132557 / TC161) TaxID=1328760 RepID=A0A165GVW7_XYLHT|nr:E3 ubiquitin-protein ligase Bre1 [Xylona heveae TC161]KZF22662.1 E3 ubiquitin-protein ligase Bre1 [Xylona heveae TC161]